MCIRDSLDADEGDEGDREGREDVRATVLSHAQADPERDVPARGFENRQRADDRLLLLLELDEGRALGETRADVERRRDEEDRGEEGHAPEPAEQDLSLIHISEPT